VEDIRILSHAFIKEASSKFGKAAPHINPELYPLLSTYSWPGNIRELRGLLFDAVSRNETDTLSLKYLKERLRELRGEVSAEQPIDEASSASTEFKIIFPSILPSIKDMEMLLIQEALHRTNGNKTQAADLLGLTRATIIKRLKGVDRQIDG
jgi:transcriptional regulator with PAS, ATPase and Fis domain